MKKIVYEAYGTPDNFKLVDWPLPNVEDEDLLIRVHASSVNPIDWKLSNGYLQAFFPLQFPACPCFDLSGVVVKVGSKVSSFKVGDEVYADAGRKQGCLAQFASVKQDLVAKKPSNMSFQQAAALPLVALTSYQCLVNVGHMTKGSKVLILGGSGGTGYVAVQIAKYLGAHVTVTSSTRNFDFVKGLGPDEVIDYNKSSWVEVLAGKDYDLIYDTVGEKGAYGKAHKVLKEGATFVTIATGKNPQDPEEAVSDKKNKFVQYLKVSNGKELEILREMAEKGALTAIIDSTFDLAHSADAFKLSIAGKAVGKISITVA
jgi:2-desacetyl-2-hydroxyethyl bacteriochlorophyllide A dehydrogenase